MQLLSVRGRLQIDAIVEVVAIVFNLAADLFPSMVLEFD